MLKKYLAMMLMITTGGALISNPHEFATVLQDAKSCIEKGMFDSALQKLKTALSCRPNTFDTDRELANNFLWLGNQFFERGENEQALETFKSILTISQDLSAVHHNIAFTLAERFGKHQEALNHYEKALLINPNNIETHFCAALSYLACANLAQGFKEYEYRWQRGVNNSRNFLEPLTNLWDGAASLLGKTFLIRAEQGLGDTLQFIRYAQILKEKGAFVIAEVQAPLLTLLKQCPYVDHVIAIGAPLPLFDYQAPLVSLPHLTKTTLATIPVNIPYLYADTTLSNYWQEQLRQESRFKIGICWNGDTTHGSAKFMPLREFEPLLKRADLKVYSLQRHNGLEQIQALAPDAHLEQFDDSFDRTHGGFMDTAAVMQHLDLVITVDTSLVHLAGGLGVPTWVIVPFPAEWRWLMDRPDSVWYPTITVFRQTQTHCWKQVMQNILKSIDQLLEIKKSFSLGA